MGVILKNVMKRCSFKSGMTFNFCEIRQDIKTDLTEWIVELLKKYFFFFFFGQHSICDKLNNNCRDLMTPSLPHSDRNIEMTKLQP